MSEAQTSLFVKLSSDRHVKLKTYAALNGQSMVQVIEDWIDTLNFNFKKND